MLGIAHVINGAIERSTEPLVRVEHQRVCQVDALPHPTALGQYHGRSRHGGIDVKPKTVAPGNLANLPYRIECSGGGGTGSGDYGARTHSGTQVLLDRASEG